jgi:serine/threonine protein kinase
MLLFMKDLIGAIREVGIKEYANAIPGGSVVYGVAAGMLKRWRARVGAKKPEDEVKELIAAKPDVAQASAEKAVAEAAPDLSERERQLLVQVVVSVPEVARQSLKRPDDPTGRTVPKGFALREELDVVKLLPHSAPRFVPGDLVPNLESWRLVRKLGGGGFGEVWLAEHAWKKAEPPAAFKFCTDPASRSRIATHEKDLIVRVTNDGGTHPNIVPLQECSLGGETPWLKYEYVPGGTLGDLVTTWQTLKPAERLKRAVPLLHTLAAAVGHFHTMKPPIVHRDLKPANVLMAGDVPRITDFGIGGAAVAFQVEEFKTRGLRPGGQLPSMLTGAYSLLYASPQQRRGDSPVDPRDDVHALGVIGYQMLVAQLDAEPTGLWVDSLQADGVPKGLIQLIGKSVAPKAEDRPPTAAAMRDELAKFLPPAKPAPPKPVAAPAPAVTPAKVAPVAAPKPPPPAPPPKPVPPKPPVVVAPPKPAVKPPPPKPPAPKETPTQLYVGNLGFAVTDADLSRVFETYGTVVTATVVTDRDSGRSKGFGFVTMSSRAEAERAIEAMHGTAHDGRPLTVNFAKPRAGGGGTAPPGTRY